MTSANHHFEDLHEGRGWLNRAAEMLDACEDHVSDAEFATAAAAIGNAFVRLAAEERAVREVAERQARVEAEARPYGDEVADDEAKHAEAEGVVWIVADGDGPLHAAATQSLAQVWAAENRDGYEGLSVTAMQLAVDRG